MTSERTDRILDWLLNEGLRGASEGHLIAGFCERVRALGVELVEAAIFLDTLHPVRESEGFYWEASKSLDTRQREFLRDDSEDNARQWRSSPFHHMLEYFTCCRTTLIPAKAARSAKVCPRMCGHSGQTRPSVSRSAKGG